MTIFFYTNQISPYMIHRWDLIASIYPDFNVVLTREPDRNRPWDYTIGKYNFNLFTFPNKIKLSNHLAYSPGLIKFINKNKNKNKNNTFHFFEDVSGLNMYLITIFNRGDNFFLINDGGFVKNTKRFSQSLRWRFIGKKCKAAMSPGDFGKKYMMAWGFPQDKIFNSFLSPDVNFFKNYITSSKYIDERNIIRNTFNIKEDDVVLFINSRLLDWKRLIDLYESIILIDQKNLNNICVLLLGDGPDKATLNLFQSQNKFKFFWLGQVKYNEILKYYSACDIFIHPSIGDIWGLVINEALLMGKPVICTNVIGAADLIVDGFNGYKVKEKSPEELSFYIKEITINNNLRSILSRNALNIYNEWNSHFFLDEFVKMINLK